MTAIADRRSMPPTRGIIFHWPRLYDMMLCALALGRVGAYYARIAGLAHVVPGESVLDVGCGTGRLMIQLRRRVGPTSRLHGVDASPEMIAAARKKTRRAGVSVDFDEGVAEALPFGDGTFDALVSATVLHCLADDARPRCFSEMRRVLKQGGRLLVVDFGGPVSERRNLIARHIRAHVCFDLGTQVSSLKEARLEPVETGPVGFGDLRFLVARAV